MQNPHSSRWLQAARALFFLNTAIWIGLAVFTTLRMAARYPEQAVGAYILGVLMLGNALAMLICGIGLGTRWRRWFYWLGFALLAVNILLTFTDQFGF